MAETNTKGLSEKAYVELGPGETYDPYVAATESPAEFTLRARISTRLKGDFYHKDVPFVVMSPLAGRHRETQLVVRRAGDPNKTR